MNLDGYIPLNVCAKRMNITETEVIHLIRQRVLRAEDFGLGLIYVEPAILSGAIPEA